jgi:subtilisin family serine protease
LVLAPEFSGVQRNHPDLSTIAGADFTDDPTAQGDGRPKYSCEIHGTPVAGVVAGKVNNGLGSTGTAPSSVVVPARAMKQWTPNDCDDWIADAAWTVEALDWAQQQGIRITVNSNGYELSNAIIQKYEDTFVAGMVHFASAGNNGADALWFPALLSWAGTVVSVGAVDRFGNRASFSNYSAGLSLTAPGLDIWTTDMTGNAGWIPGDYMLGWGTSFSAPLAAGVAALVLGVNPHFDAAQVQAILIESALDLGAPGHDAQFGHGMVYAAAAVALAANLTVFYDGFESGGWGAWSDVWP